LISDPLVRGPEVSSRVSSHSPPDGAAVVAQQLFANAAKTIVPGNAEALQALLESMGYVHSRGCFRHLPILYFAYHQQYLA
jgi:hypothetical protein